MNYIVFDLEYNQPYDFEDGTFCESEEGCPFEIIQIGAVKLNSKFEHLGDFNTIIKPRIYTRIHPYVEKLTGLSSNTLDKGMDFASAIKLFLNFIGDEKYTMCVWGSGDIKELCKNMMYYNIKYDYKKFKYINVQMLASKHLKYSAGMSVGLKNASINFNLEIDRPFHNALNDAYYTGKILQLLQKQPFSVQNFNFNKVVKGNKAKLEITNFNKLYRILEREFGRKLNTKEKKMFKNVYIMGKNKQFDILKSKE